MTELLTTEKVWLDGASGDESDDLIHVYCECNEDLALCGEDLSGPFWENAPEEDECVVCIDLAQSLRTCPNCGGDLG